MYNIFYLFLICFYVSINDECIVYFYLKKKDKIFLLFFNYFNKFYCIGSIFNLLIFKF